MKTALASGVISAAVAVFDNLVAVFDNYRKNKRVSMHDNSLSATHLNHDSRVNC